jgi:mannonate dehydratase
MKISAARVIVTCPGRNFVTLKIETDQGVYGIGDATLNGRELSVLSYLEDHVVPCLIGMDPRRIEDIWQYLYRGAYWRRGPVTMRAIAAVDVALWDIKAKMAGMPLYDLLGGRSRDGILVYGHANGSDIAETVEAVGQYIDLGYKAIRAQTGVPGVKDAYGVGRGKLFYEPADAALPSVTGWDTRKALNYVPKMFEKLRETYGFDHHLLHDGHHRYTPQEAANLGKMLEPYQLFWLEDCTPAENQEAFKLVRHHTTTPLAVGEIFNTIWDAKDLIQNQLIDYIRCTIVGAGGVTHLWRIADSRWARRCILTPGCRISAFRNTCATRPKPMTSSRMITGLKQVNCSLATPPATAWISMKSWRPNIPTSLPICPSHGWKMAQCGIGNSAIRRKV